MSLLPQSKKSAEEIAKLRESLGIVGPPPAEDALPVAAPVEKTLPAESKDVAKVDEPALAPLPVAEVHEPKPVRSLKRSERTSPLPGSEPAADEPFLPASKVVDTSQPVAHVPKIVRSLRKSEQGPLPEIHAPRPDSKLPIHRHSEEDIQRIRRQETLAMQANAGHLLSQRAHPALIIPGYLCVLAGVVSLYFYDFDKVVPAACVGVALLIAAVIFFKKPLSVHHAAFIAVAALFVVVFGALHYFPQLNHGTQRPTGDRPAWTGGH